MADQLFDIQEELKNLPGKPGVYIMRDKRDEILYVGKAVSLKNRVRQYFQKSRGRSAKIDRMVSQIERFEYIVTDSELEALVLESNLIKLHRPKYNTMLKDDKSYPYIKVTTGETWPRVIVARQMKKDSARYYGPYSNATAVRDTIDLVQKVFHIRPCDKHIESGRVQPCLYYHIGQCGAPCQGKISEEAYRGQVERAVRFLNGHVEEEIKDLTAKMEEAASDMRFEEAAGYRDLIESIRQIGEKQKITGTDGDDRDVIAAAVNEDGSILESDAVVQVFFVRGGKLIGREHFYLSLGGDGRAAEAADESGTAGETIEESGTTDEAAELPELLKQFILQYYAGTPFIPRELMLPVEISDAELVAEYLTKKRGSKVTLRVPQKGMKEKLVEMAAENAATILSRDRERLRREELRTVGAVHQIADLLGLDSAERMEAFDISNISGYESVGSMVVYERGRPKRNDYRKFRIKTVEGPNDYASMEEVLRRRFERAREGSEGFERLPDLLLMDGGRGQVNIAEKVLDEMGLEIPVCGMVKDDFHRTRGLYYNNKEVPIDRQSEGFHLITRIQDEAHRFAIEYHRLLRSKGQVRSVLDEIPGIGKTRRRSLMKHFKTIEAIKEATEEELSQAPSMNSEAASSVWRFFHKEETDGQDG